MCLFLSDSSMSSLSKATKIIKDFLEQESVTKFRPYDVQDLLQPLVSSKPQATAAHEVHHNIMI